MSKFIGVLALFWLTCGVLVHPYAFAAVAAPSLGQFSLKFEDDSTFTPADKAEAMKASQVVALMLSESSWFRQLEPRALVVRFLLSDADWLKTIAKGQRVEDQYLVDRGDHGLLCIIWDRLKRNPELIWMNLLEKIVRSVSESEARLKNPEISADDVEILGLIRVITTFREIRHSIYMAVQPGDEKMRVDERMHERQEKVLSLVQLASELSPGCTSALRSLGH